MNNKPITEKKRIFISMTKQTILEVINVNKKQADADLFD